MSVPHSRHRACRVPRAKPGQCDDRHRRDHHADLHPPDARAGDERQDGGVCRSCACAGQPAIAYRLCPYPAEYSAGAAGAGHAVHCRSHHCRGGAVVSRVGPATAGAVLGEHAECVPALPGHCALDRAMAGPGHLCRRSFLQSVRRWTARRARSQREMTRADHDIDVKRLRPGCAVGQQRRLLLYNVDRRFWPC